MNLASRWVVTAVCAIAVGAILHFASAEWLTVFLMLPIGLSIAMLTPRPGVPVPLPKRVAEGAVFAAFGFVSARAAEFLLQRNVGAASVFGLFAVAIVVGFSLGQVAQVLRRNQ